MRNFLFKLSMKIREFMRGRYGIDQLNKYLIYTVLALDIVNLVLRSAVLSVICNVLMLLFLFRMLSKNYVKRSIENTNFMNSTVVIRRRFKAIASSFKDRRNRYYLCPSCHQIVRIPRGHGKIVVTCPKCRKEFTRRS